MKQPKRNRQVDILPLLVIAVGVILVVGVITWLLLERGRASNAQTGGVQETSAPDQEIQRVSLADSKAAFDSKSAVFVDVRDPDSFKTAHIPGAINIPLGELENRISELAPNQWIILYCT